MMTIDRPTPKRHASGSFEGYVIPVEEPVIFDNQFFTHDDMLWPATDTYLLDTSDFYLNDVQDLQVARASKKRKRDYDDHATGLTYGSIHTTPPSSSEAISLPYEPLNIDPISNFVYLSEPESGSTWHYSRKMLAAQRHGLTFHDHPFTEVSGFRYRSSDEIKPILESSNSYIKLPSTVKAQLRAAARHIPKPMAQHTFRYDSPCQSVQPGQMIVQRVNMEIPATPPGMGTTLKLDNLDKSLRNFYVACMCPGRTLLPETNGWQKELLPMSDGDPIVHHALLAFSAGYCLEYLPIDKLLQRANEHYRQASELLTERLASGIEVGHEDAVVGALRLMWCDDIVQWESRRPKFEMPRWFEATQLAKQIMTDTDTGYRYWQPEKRQCTPARVSNANMLALIDIVASTVTQLVPENEKKEPHPWLLAGDEKDATRIHGGTGLSPKLLHVIAQITQICAMMSQDETSIVLPLGAKRIEDRLIHLRQWSELSRYSFEQNLGAEALLQSCQLDTEGLVTTSVAVTDLGAQAWVQAARLYLRLRFHRLPRTHEEVQQPFRLLREILRKLPCSGALFTSQSPFFPVFLYGVAAVTAEDRGVARHWFETVVDKSSSRSSVPPIWRVLQKTWNILDHDGDFANDEDVNDKPIGDRTAWWEMLVERWTSEEGFLCIV